ncbi:MAG: polysaccharide biosynthesis tyrosine autokinase, partial [Bacteroidetes bacterium]|nr:polysaccharide biosynthesis tyrosine autokinase [Bacteroidota bacterium]
LQSLAAAASSKLSTVVNLQYQDVNPKRASDVLNALIYEYELHAIEDKNTLARNTLAFVDERLDMVTKDLGQIEGKLQQYKSGRGAVDISTQGQMYLQNVSSNDQKLGETNLQLSVLDQVDNFINNNNSSGVMPSTFGVNDPTLSGMLERLHNAELEYTKLKATVGENNPKLVELRNQIAEMQPAIKQNIESQRKSLLAAKQSLQSTNSSYSSMLSTVPLKERELLDISREHGIKSSIYTFLLQKKEETELSLASAVSNSRIVDNAVTDKDPVSPKKKLIYVIALFAGMGICFLFITIRETFTGKILYRKEIEKLTTIPVIAEVAFEKTKDPIVVKHGKRSFVIEEFRKLRTSLSFLGVGSQHRKILVTSSISGEGKSFIAANLAVSIALTGKKVVLVDLDLNVPTQSKIWGVNYEFGISDYLRGQKYPEEIIKKLPGYEDLFFIPSGSLSENPSELLLNGKVNELIDYLDNSFDMVIIDTSPVVLITDAYILSEMCDATLYVMRHNYTPRMVVKRIDENLEINPINNPAIVFNGVKRRGIFRNHYGYGYNYVYGDRKYGYGKTAKS